MMNYVNEEGDNKIFFQPGDVVTLRQDIPNKPRMIVYRIERSVFRDKEHNILKGCRVRWFAEGGFLQEALFSTKDLIKL